MEISDGYKMQILLLSETLDRYTMSLGISQRSHHDRLEEIIRFNKSHNNKMHNNPEKNVSLT